MANAVPVSDTWVNYGNQPLALPANAIGATNDTAGTLKNTPVSADVSANDTTVPGSTFALSGGQPPNGAVTMNPDGTYTYTPHPDFVGQDTFTYQQCKPAPDQATCVTANVTVTVAPDAVDDTASTLVGALVSSSVATNDRLLPGSTFSLVGAPANGSLTLDPVTGDYTYTPNAGYEGTDSFSYQVCLAPPNEALCDTATVTITIAPQAVPVASDVAITGTPQPGQPITGSYNYTDVNGDLEGSSTFRWVRSPNTSIASGVQVSGARGYTPVDGDAGSYLFFCVTPIAATGANPGAEVCSPAVSVATLGATTAAIPTLSEWGLIILSSLVALGAFAGLRRRS